MLSIGRARRGPISRSTLRICAIVGLAALLGVAVCGALPLQIARAASDATLYLSPANGSFVSGSTFNMAILVNTNNQPINAVSVDISFPPELLQVVEPVPGSSFIAIWAVSPSFSNTEGKIHLEGGLPNPGITSSAGSVLTVTFRAKGSGLAKVKIGDTSKVLANDGAGTNILSSKNDASFTITAKPPAGPRISSTTHPDQDAWYNNTSPKFTWDSVEPAQAISWAYDQNPATVPDTNPEPFNSSVDTQASKDGIWYFHLRIQSNKVWGGTSHYITNIDATTPAQFTPTVEPNAPTTKDRPIVSFSTTDASSGISHYEVKAESLNQNSDLAGFFSEQQSPYILPLLAAGNHEITIRAFDKAGNVTEGKLQIKVAAPSKPLAAVATLTNLKPPKMSPLILSVIILLGIIIVLLGFLLYRLEHPKNIAVLTQDNLNRAAPPPAALPAPVKPTTLVAPPAPPLPNSPLIYPDGQSENAVGENG